MIGVKTKWIALAALAVGVGGGLWLGWPKPPPMPKVALSTPTYPQIAPPPRAARYLPESCAEAAWARAAEENAASLKTLNWAPFGRAETGWRIYAPVIAREIDTDCPPGSQGFAGALARWQAARGQPVDGVMGPAAFAFMKGVWQGRRPFVRRGHGCPDPPDAVRLTSGQPGEGYGGKHVELVDGAFEAYRRMAADAKAEVPEIAANPKALTIFSAFRSPAYDAARCARQNNCNGITRARCSPHRTGTAMDIYVGHAPGYGPDSTADPNRLAMTRSPEYRWLVGNAHRYGFVNYVFEPWHWEWIGAAG